MSSSTDWRASGGEASGSSAPPSSVAASATSLPHGTGERRRLGRNENAGMARVRNEFLADADDGLGAAEEEDAALGHLAAHAVENVALGRELEIDEHVAAENDVEGSERGEVLQEVERPELDALAQGRLDAPALVFLVEVFGEHLNRQAALRFEMRVETAPRPVDHLGRDIGANQLHRPAGQTRALLLEDHGDGIGLLPARARGEPDAQRFSLGARFNEVRQNGFAERIEGARVTEEEGLVGRHRLDDLALQRAIEAASQHRPHRLDAPIPVTPRQRIETRFKQILL